MRIALSQLKWVEHRTGIRDPQLRRESGSLHLEANIPDALRVLALAGQLGRFLRIGTCIAAVILSGRRRTVACRVFAFLCSGHKGSFYSHMSSLV